MADRAPFRAATAEAIAVLLADARRRAGRRGLRGSLHRMLARGA
jgi:hypothetical protein